jgi:hypothetical protein
MLSSAILAGDHELASWINRAVKTGQVLTESSQAGKRKQYAVNGMISQSLDRPTGLTWSRCRNRRLVTHHPPSRS